MRKKEFYNFIEHERHNRWGDDYIFMEENGKAVGRVYYYSDEPDIAYIEGLHVSEDERQKRIGSILLDKLVQKCIDSGARECMLWCYKDSWVLNWYICLGLEYCSEHQDEENAVWMIKNLITL